VGNPGNRAVDCDSFAVNFHSRMTCGILRKGDRSGLSNP
jgi:hypothetical protein